MSSAPYAPPIQGCLFISGVAPDYTCYQMVARLDSSPAPIARHVRRKGALLAALLALPTTIVAAVVAIQQVATLGDPGALYWPPNGALAGAIGIAAIVVAPPLGWRLADRVRPGQGGFHWRLAIWYAVLCDVVGAAVAGTLISATTVGRGDWLRMVSDFALTSVLFAFSGVALLGFPAFGLIFPCACIWVWLMGRGRTRSVESSTAPG